FHFDKVANVHLGCQLCARAQTRKGTDQRALSHRHTEFFAIDVSEAEWVIGGGEDHSLLATFSPDAVLPRAFKPIGVVLPAGQAPVLLGLQALPEKGWDSVRS
ncbi:MAG: hypothetical protein RLZZ90_1200, partial [Actinomycetota bacterium]